jgi:ketosteroid isomerase-like protein
VDASSNAEIIKRYVEAFKRKDWQAATAFWADDVILHAQGRHPLAGHFFGKQAFLEHVSRVSAQLGATIELVEVYDVMFSAEHAVGWVKERAVCGERSLVFDRVNVYRMSDGKITEVWMYDSDPYALDEFFS